MHESGKRGSNVSRPDAVSVEEPRKTVCRARNEVDPALSKKTRPKGDRSRVKARVCRTVGPRGARLARSTLKRARRSRCRPLKVQRTKGWDVPCADEKKEIKRVGF